MTPSFHAFLVNGRFGDPAVYVDMRFSKRAVLFDLGDIHQLEPRKIFRLTDVFVTHTHMDHFVGFDRLVRVMLGRGARLHLFGPAGFIDRVCAKLDGYSWNLTERFAADLVLDVTEVAGEDSGRAARFCLKEGFRCEELGARSFDRGILYADDQVVVQTAIVDHGIPSLAFALSEPIHVNVRRDQLEKHGLSTGPWLRELKTAVATRAPDDTMISVGGKGHRNRMSLGELREVIKLTRGQKIVYATDFSPTKTNARRIERLADDADLLFIEATFSRADMMLAQERHHLTTEMAGQIAAAAGVRRIEPFHFSKRYDDPGAEMRMIDEVESAFRTARAEKLET